VVTVPARRVRDIRVPTPWLDPTPPPPVPRRVVPLQDETCFSYLARVAAANHVPDRAITDRLVGRPPDTDEDPLVRSRWIAALCGIDQQRLLSAVPELQVGSTGPDGPLPVTGRPLPNRARSRPPCRFCAARRGAIPVLDASSRWTVEPEVWLSAEDNVCRRHQVWIGPDADHYDRQLDLRALPEVVQAQTRHRRLVRSLGRRETFLAYLDATDIWWKLAWLHGYDTERDQRLHRHLGPGVDPEDLDFHDPLRCAVIYPETVALTSLLASGYWRKKIIDRRSRARPARDASAWEAFHAEFTRRVTPHHHQHALVERLVREHLADPERRYRLADRQP
jgi:hypothetical protein